MKHTPTPWKLDDKDIVVENEIIVECVQYNGDYKTPRANAEHIVKCVNAHSELMEFLESLQAWGHSSLCPSKDCIHCNAEKLLQKYGDK